MVLTLPKEKTDDQTDEEYSSYLQDFDPAQDFLDKYTESTDPTKTDFGVEAYKGDEGRGFFSPDGAGRPDEEVAAVYGGAKGQLKREVEAFGKQFPIRTTDTPVDRPRGRGMGDRWEGPQSDASSDTNWRPRTVEVGRIASTDGRGLLGGRREPSYRPTSANPEGQAGGSASRLGGRTGGLVQQSGVRQTGTSTSFNTPSSANPNIGSVFLQKQLTNLQGSPSDAGQRNPNWWGQGRTPGENTRPWGDVRQSFGINVDENTLLGEDYKKQQISDDQFAKGKTPSGPLRGYRALPGFGTVKTAAANVRDVLTGNRTVADVYKNPKTLEQVNPGGFQSGPTPAVRQAVQRGAAFVPKLGAYVNTAALLYKGMDAATRARTGQTLAERVSNPVATFERNAEQYKEQAAVNRAKRDEMVGGVKDWFVDKMGNVKKDVQTRQLRQAGIGTDVRGNVVSENQRIKAADDFIAGVENWEPLTDQSTFEDIPEVQGGIVDGQWDDSYQVAPEAKTEITPSVVSEFGATNQPATVDLNESTPATPPPTPEVYAEDYVSPSQPYDEQEPVGNYITNEDTGEVYPIADAPSVSESVGVLPSQEAWTNPTSSDFTNPAADRAWADYQALIKKNEAENRSRYSRYSASGYGHMDDDGNYSYRYRLPFPTYTNAGESAASAAWESASQGGSYRNIPSYNVVNAHLL